MYKVGMYGGSFDPLHLGHINNIMIASGMCETLHIVLSYGILRDRINYQLRYRWLTESCKHLPNVKIHAVEDFAGDKNRYDWEYGAKCIKQRIGEEIDIVFCGDDYRKTNKFETLYPNSTIFYLPRSIIKVSSTEIIAHPFDYWDYIPKAVRPYFCKKVLIIGGESTGKSTLVQSLANVFNTTAVAEYGRYTCERAGGEEYMTKADLYENLIMQRAEIFKAEQTANKLLIVDTDSLTTAFYGSLLSNGMWESVIDLGNDINSTIDWDLVIFLEPTVPFVQDGTRNEEIARNRKKYSDMLKSFYNRKGVRYETIDGDYTDRFLRASELIRREIF